MIRSLTLLTLAGLLVAADATPDAAAPVPAAAPAAAPAPAETPAAVPAADATAAPRTLSLADAIKLSASTAPVGISNLDSAIAKAGLGSERMTLLPNLSATAGVSRQKIDQTVGENIITYSPYNDLNARLRLGQAILDLEAVHRTRSAERQLAAAEATATVALETAAANAGQTYVSLASAQALVTVRQEDLRLAKELLTQAKAQVDAGTTEAIAATRAANRVATAQSALTTAEGGVKRAEIALARALDIDPAQHLVAGATLDDGMAAGRLPDSAAKAEQSAHLARPELRVSLETLGALEEARLAAQGARLPRLDGFAEGGYNGPAFDNTERTWSIGIGLTVPLLDGSSYREEQATLRAAQQRLRGRQLDDQIKAEVRDAFTVIQTALARLTSDQDRKRLADEELRLARTRFDAGAASNLEVIDAQRGLSAAQEGLLQSTEALVQARVQLAKAIGAATGIN